MIVFLNTLGLQMIGNRAKIQVCVLAASFSTSGEGPSTAVLGGEVGR